MNDFEQVDSTTGATVKPEKPVVACVDGSDDADRALRFAIERARVLNTGIRLMHVAPSSGSLPPRANDQILDEAVARCAELCPGLVVTVSSRRGDKHNGFIGESRTAECLVLGTHQTTTDFGPASSTNLASVAAHCPVITVPPGWEPGNRQRPVVVAVSGPEEVVELVEPALYESRLRGTGLVILHAWRPPDPYPPSGSIASDEVPWAEVTERELHEAIAAISADFPDVPVAVQVSPQAPEVALAEACEDACLLVLGHHHSFMPMVSGVGRVPYAALHAGACPVEIVPTSMKPTG